MWLWTALAAATAQDLTFHASFDKGTDADVAAGDKRLYTAANYKAQLEATPGLDHPDVGIVPGGKHGSALQFRKKNVKAIFYRADKNASPRDGTLSFWLNLDPDQDLEPGFCDPIQVTDKAYNDSAIWVDFTKDEKPRHFRLGVFGELKAWNPQNLPADKFPDFEKRLIRVTKTPFARGKWTHVAITYTGLGSAQGGVAKLYLDGKLQGTTAPIRELFSWDPARAALRLGVSYVGLFDELKVFRRALSEREIRDLK